MVGKTKLLEYIVNPLRRFGLNIVGACRDLLPIILVILIFQLAVVRQPFPDVLNVFVGLILVILGLALFVVGLEIGPSPIAEAFARKGSLSGEAFF